MADVDVDPDGSRTGWEQVVAAIGEVGIQRFEAMVDLQKPFRDRLIPKDGWYLPWLAVDPVGQRSGAGTALLRAMFARLDADGAASYLETENEVNVPYYLKQGYELVHEDVLPYGPRYFCFLRQAPSD